jgi:hypothetical protein
MIEPKSSNSGDGPVIRMNEESEREYDYHQYELY